jgi:hypothetical protein
MSDVPGIVKSLFPTARITSTKRSPMSALGRANPRSYHNIGKAIDIAPIPGVKFQDYVTSLRNAGVQIIEAKNEVGKGRSKHATGDHWHIAYETDVAPRKAPVKAPEAVKMASAKMDAPDMPDAPDFDMEAETESQFASLLAGLGKKKRGKKAKPMGILAGLI